MKSVQKLSTKEHWDSIFKHVKLPRINSPDIYGYFITMQFIDEVLKDEKKKTFLEIGCGASGWLPYFARKYSVRVSGLDYAEEGCRLAEENLKILGIRYGEIICTDFFAWKSIKKYDIIFSYGVLEHFENPETFIELCHAHLNDDGIIISLVPNLNGIIGTVSNYVVPEIYRMHKVISKDDLKAMHEEQGFKNIKTDYAGIFSLSVIPWEKSKLCFFKENSLRRFLCLKIISLTSLLLSTIFKRIRQQMTSRCFSPYLITVMRKIDT
ncbi:MAG TPA: class I SAM-dependent methyltransferase [Candidatus Wunengus sp. YC63]|uniref:class I SAM-dependent methyltransferase n=1 Tax=unclassified Candidatus Wunengus TaxID=3367695 RepID=UPI00402982DF